NPKTFDCSFPDGPASSKVKVSADDGDAGGIATDEIEVAVSNLAPTADAHGPYSGPWGSAISFNGSATDPAGSHDTLSYEWDFDYDGSTFDVDSHVEDPSHSYAGPGTYTAALRVSDEDGGTSAIKTVNVNVAKRSTTLSYTGDGSEQYSDEQTLTAELKDGSQGIQGKTITFTVGTQQVSATTNANGVASTTLLIDQAPGSYTVRTSFAGNGYYTSSYDSDPFTIAKENARAAYTGAEFVSTSSATSSTATVTLAATIRDITAVTGDPDYDSHAGDIRNAKVDFVNVDTGATLCDNLPVGLVNSADPKVGTATCNWTANIGNANSSTFTIGIKVGKSSGRYARDSSTDDTTVTVSKPLNDFITGGGFLVNGSASGQISPTQGQKTNFGFNVKYNKANTNLQGNINAIVRSGAKTYQVKGNSMTSLAANNTTRKATFNGKANIQDITNATNPVSVDGNASLQVTMTDNGDPGSPDTIGITVWNKQGGLWFASKWDGTRTLEQTLGGGNLLVH
ncbi:MAG: PKD domain-containing protein, partial [Solirubrobacterales bacterium]